MAPAKAIECDALTKIYRGELFQRDVKALDGISFSIEKGETFGLLGPNGAGKTTLQKLLLGIIKPTQGSGKILGLDLGSLAARKKVGYLPENPYFYFYLTGEELLKFTGELFDLSPQLNRQLSRKLLDQLGLSRAGNRQLRTYSKGMLQRIGIAQALINDPELVFLDEPMSGLDPIGRKEVKDIIISLKQQGKTVFFNSHILSDVEALCDRVGILNHGHLVSSGHIKDLLSAGEGLEDYFVRIIQQDDKGRTE